MEHLSEFIKNHWELWLALVVILGMLIFEEFKKKAQGSSNLTAQEVAALMNHEEVVVIDIRTSAIFQKGHIFNACNIPKADFTVERIAPYKNRTIVIVDENGYDAASIGNKIKQDKGAKVYTLNGGIATWRNANLPLTKK